MKNIIITGTSRGIGFELVQQLASQGHNLLALSRHTATIEALNLPNVHCIPFDITLETDREAVAHFVKEQWKQVDILIHNAGRLINKPFEELTEEDFWEVYKEKRNELFKKEIDKEYLVRKYDNNNSIKTEDGIDEVNNIIEAKENKNLLLAEIREKNIIEKIVSGIRHIIMSIFS